MHVREVSLAELVDEPQRVTFHFGPECSREPIRDGTDSIVGMVERRQKRVEGTITLAVERVGESHFRVSAGVENETPFVASDPDTRDAALMHSLVSTHTILGVYNGVFESLLDPPKTIASAVASCQNIGTWPVLIGSQHESDTMLSSPITLYDDPQVAPESPGDLFDATEIDEILTLRILTLSDSEKRSMATLDSRGRALLERTESLAREQLMGLHGKLRDLRPVKKGEARWNPGVTFRTFPG